MSKNSIRLTQYSHGADCGYRVSPKVLKTILHSEQAKLVNPNLLVGDEIRDDTTVYDLGNGTSVISTTDFFMPTVGNPFDFGRIAATDATSDIFAMEGKPIMVIVILGWPINKLSPKVAHKVTESGRYACRQAGTTLAGSHSIDVSGPILGLAIMGIVPTERVKRSNTVQTECKLLLTRPLGIGVLTTAEKKSLLKPEHQGLAMEVVCRMNITGAFFTNTEGIKAMTDVTGFGLLGRLNEMRQGAGVQTRVGYEAVPKLPGVEEYIKLDAVPDDTERNFVSYGYLMGEMLHEVHDLLCNPQISGGLLLAAMPEAKNEVKATAAEFGTELTAVNELVPARGGRAMVKIR